MERDEATTSWRLQGLHVGVCYGIIHVIGAYAVVTPLRKAASYEPRIAILGILG